MLQTLDDDNEDFEIINNPEGTTREAETGGRASEDIDEQKYRSVSITSDDLLGEVNENLVTSVGVDLEREDENLEFHLSDDQQFEVLDTAEGGGKGQSEKHIEVASPRSDVSGENIDQEGVYMYMYVFMYT